MPILYPQRTIYLDTETTGLNRADDDDVLELSVINDAGDVLLDTLIQPIKTSWPDAQRIHGITPDDVKDAPTLHEIAPQLLDIMHAHRACVMYNAAFDNQFIERAFKLINADYPNIIIRCAMQLYAGYYSPVGRWCRLIDAAEHAGHVWTGNAHRALADAQATRSVWRLLRERGKISEIYGDDEYNHGCEF